MAGHRSKGYLSNDRRIDGIGLFVAMDRYIALQDADLFTFQTRILQDTDETNFTYLIRRSDFPGAILRCYISYCYWTPNVMQANIQCQSHWFWKRRDGSIITRT